MSSRAQQKNRSPQRAANLQASLLRVLVVSALILGGCASTPHKDESKASREDVSAGASQSFSSDLYVERNDKSFKLKCDINLINGEAVRLDLTNTLDLPLASIVLTSSRIDYALYRDRRFYTGRPNSHALDPVFPLAIDVDTLMALLKEQDPSQAQCHRATDKKECVGKTGDTTYKISWSKPQETGPLAGRFSKIVLELPQRHVSLKFILTAWQKNVSNAQRLQSLQVPQGFKIISAPEH